MSAGSWVSPPSSSASSASPSPLPLRLLSIFSSDSDLTVVCARPGFGACTLVRSWLQADRGPTGTRVVWISPPQKNQSLDEYWRSILEAVHPYRSALQLPFSVDRADEIDPVQALLELFEVLSFDFVLVLEKVDLVSGPSLVVEHVRRLTKLPNLTIIATVVGSSQLTDELVRLSDTHVSAQDLLFSTSETVRLWQELGLPQPQVFGERIHAVSRGVPRWVGIAVELGRQGVEPVVDAFDRPSPDLVEAVLSDLRRVLGSFDPAVAPRFRSLVLTIAPARLVTRETAAELLPRGVSVGETIDILENSGLLLAVERKGDAEPHWSFPEVVRSALLVLAREQNAEHVASTLMFLSRRASKYEEYLCAAQYAADAGNWESALDIVEKHWVGMVTHHLSQLRELLDAVPSRLLEDRPSVKAGKAVFVGMLAHTPALDPVLPASDLDLLEFANDPAVATAIHVATAQSIGLRVAGRYREAMALTRKVATLATVAADRQPHIVGGQLPVLRLQWAITFQLAGAEIDATAQFMQTYRGAVAGGIEFVARNSAGNLALLWAVAGHVPRADMWLTREVDFGDGGAVLAPMVRVGGLVATVLTRLDRLDTPGATAALTELREPSHREELWAHVAYAHAQHALITGSAYSGLAMVQRLADERVLQCSPSSFARILITSVRADLHLALGQGNLAAATIDETELDHPILVMAAARVALYTGRPEQALAIVAQSSAPNAGAPRVHIEALLIRAAARLALGALETAVQCWRTACELAEQSACYRPFTTVSATVRRRLSDASGIAPSPNIDVSIFPEAVALIQLSAREHVVLTGLARGMSSQQIADEQFVSSHTIRSQMRTVYRKLGAHSKAEAITIARTLRLLDDQSEPLDPSTSYHPDEHRN